METSSRRKPIAKLLLPKPALAGCIFGAFVRDTRGCDLPFDQRFNHFASSPLCCVSYLYEGQTHLLEDRSQFADPESAPVFPRLTFSGPYQKPPSSWNSGDIYAMTIAFYPDAMTELTGIDVTDYLNRTLPLDEVISGDLLDMFQTVFALGNSDEGFAQVEQLLLPFWQRSREGISVFGFGVADWCRSIAIRAATSGIGKSTRQIERRVRRWAGQSQSKLESYAKTEETFQHALAADASGQLDLADISAALGYSDQSHMGRHVKKVTGYSPAEFMRRYGHDETLWSYRLMGERF